jgi:hypothetical protein
MEILYHIAMVFTTLGAILAGIAHFGRSPERAPEVTAL